VNIHTLYRPFLRYFRPRRMRAFYQSFPITAETQILDVGGFAFNWSLLPVRPRLTFLNLDLPGEAEKGCHWIIGDGRLLPFQDRAFEIVFSNSVIEHLGSFESQQMFAREIARVGRFYWVQTPNRWFLVEPHLITPLVHFLPQRWQKRLLKNFTVWGLITRASEQECERFLNEIQLLDCQKMKVLFPEAEIRRERFLGLTKSLIAAKAFD